MTERTVKMRRWIRWTILAVWILTAVSVLVLTQIHVPLTASITLRTREISLSLNPVLLLNNAEESQLSISGPAKFSLVVAGTQGSQTIVTVDAPTPAASCTFYLVRTDSLTFVDSPVNSSGEARMALIWPLNADGDSFIARMPQHLAGNLVAAHGPSDHSSFACSGVSSSLSDQHSLSGVLSENGGSSFRTRGAFQMTLRQESDDPLKNTNLHVAGRVWVGHIDPLAIEHATATLLQPLPGRKNAVSFDGLPKNVEFNTTDLIEVDPSSHFDVGSILARNGMQIELHGIVNNLRSGTGSNDLVSCMPSAFDLLDSRKRIFGVIPGIVTAIIGFLEALGLLPARKTR
jgi:hypothetical protein